MDNTIIISYIVLINIATFLVYHADKKKAQKGKWRIPESTLIALSFFGGSIGAYLAMKLLRHKTQHKKFQICVPLSLILHILILIWWIEFILLL